MRGPIYVTFFLWNFGGMNLNLCRYFGEVQLPSEGFFLGLDKIGAWVTIFNKNQRILRGYKVNFYNSSLSKVFAG